MHAQDVLDALVALRQECQREGIPFAVVGALAWRQHGYVRFTEDIDIVTTREGLAKIHDRLVGRGLVPRGVGLKKKLRDAIHKVNIDVIQAGEHAGARDSPVVYPDPGGPEFGMEREGVRYATLPALLTFKIGSGVWGKRPKDLADAIELIKANRLDESYAANLIEPVRAKFAELVEASRQERDIE